MTSTESNTITSDDCTKATKLLRSMKVDIEAVNECIKRLTNDVKNGLFDTKKGISLLDLKYNCMLMYMTNLAHTTQLKLNGTSLNQHPVIDRLIEQRITIERLAPYESKLKHQIDQYIQDAKAAVDGEADLPEETKIAPKTPISKGLAEDNFDDDDESDKGESDEEEVSATVGEKKLTYRVPKISQNRFVEDDKMDKEEKAEAAKRRLLNSAMMQDALYEYQEDPDVIYNSSNLQRKAIKRREEIRKFEEDNFRRLSLSKQERAALKGSNTAGKLHKELLTFSDVGILGGTSAQTEGGNKKRRRSSSAGRKSNKKKKGGKFKH